MTRCGRCGGRLRRGSSFCGRCGAPVGRRRRWSCLLAALVVTALALCAAAVALWGGWTAAPDDGSSRDGGAVIGATDGCFTLVEAGIIEDEVADEAAAWSLMEKIGPSLGISDPRGELSDPDEQEGLGITYYRFDQSYQGIPVYGRDVVVAADEGGDVLGVTGNYLLLSEIATDPQVSAQDAAEVARAGDAGVEARSGSLCVYSLGENEPTLAWQVETWGEMGQRLVFVSALDGSVVAERELTNSLGGVSATDVDGNEVELGVRDNGDGTYTLFDEDRNIRAYQAEGRRVSFELEWLDEDGNSYEWKKRSGEYGFVDSSGRPLSNRFDADGTLSLINESGETVASGVRRILTSLELDGESLSPYTGSLSDIRGADQKKLVSLQSYAANTIDFYRECLARNGFNDRGGEVHVVSDAALYDARIIPESFNAFTNSTRWVSLVRYGKELPVSQAVMGHEITHAMINYISQERLGEGEAGAVVEAICDLMGMAVEDYQGDGRLDGDCGWEIPQLRNLSDPNNSDGGRKHLPAEYEGKYWSDRLAIHEKSTVISHAGYLMCCGDGLEGDALSVEQLAKLLYLSLFWLPSDCTFSQTRVIIENACEAMIGRGLLTRAQANRVSAAFDAVNVMRTDDLYGLTEGATLQVFDVNNQPYADYIAYVAPWKQGHMPDHDGEDTWVIRPSSEDPVALGFQGWGKYTVEAEDRQGLRDGDPSTKSWSVTVSVGLFGKKESLKLYTSFGEVSAESPQAQVAQVLPENEMGGTGGKRDVALVLDVSDSMSGDPLDRMKEAAEGFIGTALDGGAQVGLVSYNDEAEVRQGLTSSERGLVDAVEGLSAEGRTNFEEGLAKGGQVLAGGDGEKRIYVLMSDGAPNEGKVGDELIAYAGELKARGAKIYTVGFNEGAQGYALLSAMASEGCHYEVKTAEDLAGFFADIADEISGTRFVYVRAACPVDVEVSHEGETLSSAADSQNLRTSFGTLSFEDELDEGGGVVSEDGVKVLRLREGPEYEVSIVGTGEGEMDYTVGFVNEDGDYADFRLFEGIGVNVSTRISTSAARSERTRLVVDEDGDGVVDRAYEAGANERASEVDSRLVVYATVVGCVVMGAGFVACARGVAQWRRMRREGARAA